MSILSGFLKTKRRRLTDEGYILQSEWTSASSVEFANGMNAEEKVLDIEGIELTKAEYDALSEEEKKTGTYWITDINNESGSSTIYLESSDVVNNLSSIATNLPLSANQGKVLNEQMLHIVSFDATTGTLITKSWDYVEG